MPRIVDNFSKTPAENGSKPAPLGAPEGALRSDQVSDTFRTVMAGIAENTEAIDAIGGVAAQNPANVAFTGGTISGVTHTNSLLSTGVIGAVPIGGIILGYMTQAEADALKTVGYIVCDGRTEAAFTDVRGTTRGPFTAPDLRDKYPIFKSSTRPPKSTGGSFNTSDAGAHTHTTDGLFFDFANFNGSGSTAAVAAVGGGNTDRTVTLGTDDPGDHHHTIEPPYVSLVPLWRAF